MTLILAILINHCYQQANDGISFKVLSIQEDIARAKFWDGSQGKVNIANPEEFNEVDCEI